MDDDLPLASLAMKKTKRKRNASTASRARSVSPRRSKKRAVLRAYGLDGELMGEVTRIHEFIADHPKGLPLKIGFVVLGAAGPILMETQAQLGALPAGMYNAQVIYTHPTKKQLEAFQRRLQTTSVGKASRLK